MRVRGTIDRPHRTTTDHEASAAARPGPSRSSPDIVQRTKPSESESETEQEFDDEGGKPPKSRKVTKESSTQATPESEGPDWASYDTKRALRILSTEADPGAGKKGSAKIALRMLACYG